MNPIIINARGGMKREDLRPCDILCFGHMMEALQKCRTAYPEYEGRFEVWMDTRSLLQLMSDMNFKFYYNRESIKLGNMRKFKMLGMDVVVCDDPELSGRVDFFCADENIRSGLIVRIEHSI